MKLSEYLSYVRSLRNRIQFYEVKLDNWYDVAPCQTAPKYDPRSLINCCSPSIRCPIRDAILFSLSKLPVLEETYDALIERYRQYKRSRGTFNVRGFFRYTPYRDKR